MASGILKSSVRLSSSKFTSLARTVSTLLPSLRKSVRKASGFCQPASVLTGLAVPVAVEISGITADLLSRATEVISRIADMGTTRTTPRRRSSTLGKTGAPMNRARLS